MSTYLVVANQTVTSPRLVDELKSLRERDDQAEFALVVPATPVRHLFFLRDSEEKAEEVARKHAEKGRSRLSEKGIKLADVRVVSGDPAEAIEQELQSHPDYAGVVISTLAGTDSRWLKMGLPQTIQSKTDKPVIVVEAPPTFVGP